MTLELLNTVFVIKNTLGILVNQQLGWCFSTKSKTISYNETCSKYKRAGCEDT